MRSAVSAPAAGIGGKSLPPAAPVAHLSSGNATSRVQSNAIVHAMLGDARVANRAPENEENLRNFGGFRSWAGPGSNRRHMDFQSIALPTELPARGFEPAT